PTARAYPHAVRAVALSARGGRFALAEEKAAEVRDAEDGKRISVLAKSAVAFEHLTMSRDGTRVAAVKDLWTIVVWDAGDGRVIRTLRDVTKPVNGLALSPDRLALSPDGRELAVAGGGQGLSIWDVTTGRQATVLLVDSTPVRGVVF